MIKDTLNRIERYHGLSPRLDQAIDFLAAADLAALETGRHIIDGDRIYAYRLRFFSWGKP